VTRGASDIAAHLEFFATLGVTGVSRDPAWRRREERFGGGGAAGPEGGAVEPVPGGDAADSIVLASEAAIDPPRGSLAPAEALAVLRADVGPQCTRCKLCALGRRQVVFGVGNPKARLMFVGEAPGEDEDRQGEPFVGRAGQLLTKIIEAINLSRDQVYIANVIKCRPPGNRNPEPDEVAACEPFLFQQIAIVQPRVIVALGKFAAQSLLRTTEPITRMRGREFEYRGATLIPTFHPAYLLRNPPAKREVWEDMKKVRAILVADQRP
jgi:uracil-DNA glycosylase family 4